MPMIKQVKCPQDGHRLFDVDLKTTGCIDVKCQICKKIIVVEINNNITTKIK